MQFSKVPGQKRHHKVVLYALSTCAWCRMTKQFLEDSNVEFEYVYVDLCEEEDKHKIREHIQSKGGPLSYPTIIVDDNVLITGFRTDKIRESLGL